MCGIFGTWQTDGRPLDISSIQRATRALAHRGPDDEGYLLVSTRDERLVVCGGQDTRPDARLPGIDGYRGEPFDLALGFRRLAILDLSPAGHQPMSSPDGRLWIVYNGEIYNYLELRAELAQRGFAFHSGCDTEVILAAYQYWGPDCLQHFNGMWSFALWDAREQCLVLARDRFGIKPLYFTHREGIFTFASEIKALVGTHGVPFEPDDETVYGYLAGGRLPNPQGDRTFFRNVRSLPPGHSLIVQHGTATSHRYWTLDTGRTAERTTPTEIVERYGALFEDAVRLRLRSDVPIGTCLSGGVDSSSIVCVINRLMTQDGIASEQIGQQQKTFSAVYDTPAPYNERAYVEKVLAATSAEQNFVVPTMERLQAEIERLVWHQDEPFQSTSIFAQWCVMSQVRQRGVTVLLDGQGADETLAGYSPFAIFLGDFVRQGRMLAAVREALALRNETGLPAARLLGFALAWQLPEQAVLGVRDAVHPRRRAIQALARTSALRPEFAQAMAREPSGPSGGRPADRSLQHHLLTLVQESLPNLLRYEDRNSMAFGVEARVPFLDYRLVELAFGAAAAWRIHDGWTKWVLRRAMAGTVPGDVIWRRGKIGFETPEADWLRRWFGARPDFFGQGALSDRYLDLAQVRQRIASRIDTDSAARHSTWRWINLELWLQVWSRQTHSPS